MPQMNKKAENSKSSAAVTSANGVVKESRLVLHGLVAAGWEIVEPLPISVQVDEDGQYLLTDEIFAVFGEGNNLSEARKDLVTSLIEYYELIAGYEDAPSRELLTMLSKYLRPH